MNRFDCHNDIVVMSWMTVSVCVDYRLIVYEGLLLCFNLKEMRLVTIGTRREFNSEITLKNSVYYNLKV